MKFIFMSFHQQGSVSSAGFLQLAGGTNFHTVDGLKKERFFQSTSPNSLHALIGGIAYGGYARKVS